MNDATGTGMSQEPIDDGTQGRSRPRNRAEKCAEEPLTCLGPLTGCAISYD